MDNVTHALIGVLLARAALPWIGSLRGALWAAVLASEGPDLDLVLTPFFEDQRLGYLVHHRGHTHTLIGAAMLAFGAAGFAAWRDPAARRGPLVALALVGAFLHIGADAWNNYGVHPFWPLDATWRYGDMVFILEPLLWFALLPVAFTIASRRVRVALGGLGVVMAGVTGVGLGPAAAIGWALGTGALTALQLRRDRLLLPAALAIGALIAFGAASRATDAALRARLGADRPGEEVLDVVLTPRAATPWCWQGFVLSRDTTTYRARAMSHSLAPALTSPADCLLARGDGRRTAPSLPPDLADGGGTIWREVYAAPVASLVALAAEECRVDAFLRFARAPYWLEDGQRLVVGDLRYDFEPELGFAEVETIRTMPPDARGCEHLPPWRSVVVERLLAE